MKGIPLNFTIHLHCLIPPKMGNLMIPMHFGKHRNTSSLAVQTSQTRGPGWFFWTALKNLLPPSWAGRRKRWIFAEVPGDDMFFLSGNTASLSWSSWTGFGSYCKSSNMLLDFAWLHPNFQQPWDGWIESLFCFWVVACHHWHHWISLTMRQLEVCWEWHFGGYLRVILLLRIAARGKWRLSRWDLRSLITGMLRGSASKTSQHRGCWTTKLSNNLVFAPGCSKFSGKVRSSSFSLLVKLYSVSNLRYRSSCAPR